MAEQYGGLFTRDMIIQLNTVFDKMDKELVLRLYPDERPLAEELAQYLLALCDMCPKLTLIREEAANEAERPYVKVFFADGTEAGTSFHGVPGGHEFTPFILSLYNLSGPGQPIDARDKEHVLALEKAIEMKIMVSLNCTMCPELVTAAQRIASLNRRVKVDVYDINHFPAMREAHQVQNVPCFIVNGSLPMYGKKSLPALLEIFTDAEEIS